MKCAGNYSRDCYNNDIRYLACFFHPSEGFKQGMKKILLIVLLLSLGFSHTTDLPSKLEIEMMTEEEKLLLYEKHKINPYLNLIYPIPPISIFVGYYKINHFGKGILKYFMFFAGTQSLLALGTYDTLGGIDTSDEAFQKRIDTAGNITIAILACDLFYQTKKYNRDLYKTIFDDIPE